MNCIIVQNHRNSFGLGINSKASCKKFSSKSSYIQSKRCKPSILGSAGVLRSIFISCTSSFSYSEQTSSVPSQPGTVSLTRWVHSQVSSPMSSSVKLLMKQTGDSLALLLSKKKVRTMEQQPRQVWSIVKSLYGLGMQNLHSRRVPVWVYRIRMLFTCALSLLFITSPLPLRTTSMNDPGTVSQICRRLQSHWLMPYRDARECSLFTTLIYPTGLSPQSTSNSRISNSSWRALNQTIMERLLALRMKYSWVHSSSLLSKTTIGRLWTSRGCRKQLSFNRGSLCMPHSATQNRLVSEKHSMRDFSVSSRMNSKGSSVAAWVCRSKCKMAFSLVCRAMASQGERTAMESTMCQKVCSKMVFPQRLQWTRISHPASRWARKRKVLLRAGKRYCTLWQPFSRERLQLVVTIIAGMRERAVLPYDCASRNDLPVNFSLKSISPFLHHIANGLDTALDIKSLRRLTVMSKMTVRHSFLSNLFSATQLFLSIKEGQNCMQSYWSNQCIFLLNTLYSRGKDLAWHFQQK